MTRGPRYWVNELVDDFHGYLDESGIRVSRETLIKIFYELAVYYDLEKAIKYLRKARHAYRKMIE